jgi:branched-chain amino acid transport system permease protein
VHLITRKRVRRRGRWELISAAALAAAFVAAGPILEGLGQDYWVTTLTRAALLGVLGLTTDLAWGATGIFTLGQAVFFGIGAYSTGLISTKHDVDNVIELVLLAAAMGGAGGLLLGTFLFYGRRRVGPLYVGLVTLALTYVLQQAAITWDWSGAANGIPAIPLPTLFGSTIRPGMGMFALACALLILTLAISAFLRGSQLGLAMKAVRDDDERAEFLGYRRSRVQVLVFTVAAALAATAGSGYALNEGFVSPSFLGVALSTQAVVYVIVGGRGFLAGPLLGVLLIEVGGQRIQESLDTSWPIVIGSIMLAVIILLPGGLVELAQRVGAISMKRGPRAGS